MAQPEEHGFHGGLNEQELKDLKDHNKDLIENPPTSGGDDKTPSLGEKLSNLSEKAFEVYEDELKLSYGAQSDDICFPENLREKGMKNGTAIPKELMRISLVSRDHAEKKNIWLHCPPGISIPDGVEYNQVS